MSDNQKAFLNELSAMMRKYNIDAMTARDDNGRIMFESNGTRLAFSGYDDGTFFDVTTYQTEHHVPETC